MDVVKARDALPKKLRDACDEAIREFEKLWAGREAGTIMGYEHTKSNRAYAAMKRALGLVGLERDPAGPEQPAIERVDELTTDQRNVVAVLSQRPIPLEVGWSRIGLAAPRRRRWLGIDPPGVLDEPGPDGRPRYEADDPLASLPVERHLEAVLEGLLGEYPRSNDVTSYSDVLEKVLAKHAKHGGAYAARVLPTLKGESRFVIDHVVTALFLALIRSNTPIPEGADRLLPIARHMQVPTPIDHLIEIVGGLPPGRREAAVIAAMQRSDGRSNEVLRGVTAVLAKLPMPNVLEAALAFAKQRKQTKDSAVKSDLVKLERELKAMTKGVAAPKPSARFELRVESALRPTSVDELDPIRVKQLAVAGDTWEGTRRPAARRLSADENDESSFGGVCEWRVLVGDGRRYDAWLFAGDSGAYFVAGTTKRIAEMIQRSVAVLAEQDVDTGLAEALSAASTAAAGRSAKAPAKAKAAPKPKAKATPKPKAKATPKPRAKATPKPRATPKPKAKAAPKPKAAARRR